MFLWRNKKNYLRIIIKYSTLTSSLFQCCTSDLLLSFPGPAQGCGGVLNTTTAGRLTSIDSDNDGLYEHNLDCRWTILGGDNKVILLNIEGMDIEQHQSCVFDYIKVCSDTFGKIYCYIYAPNFEAVGRAYCFWVVLPSVCPVMMLFLSASYLDNNLS